MFENFFSQTKQPPSQHELNSHPLMREVMKDIEETRRQQEMDAREAQIEAQRMRAEAGKLASAEVDTAIAGYEALRVEMHEQLRKLWASSQYYSKLTGVLPPQLPLVTFNSVNLPKLDSSHYESGFSTTRVGVMAYMASNGKQW